MTSLIPSLLRRAPLAQRWRRRLRGEDGMSLIELLVAFTVLAIVMSGSAAGLASAMALSSQNRGRSAAAAAAASELELQRGLPFTITNHPPGVQPPKTVTVGGFPYTVAVTKTWVNQPTTFGPCDVGSVAPPPAAFLRVDVAVTWAGMGALPAVRNQTTIAPPSADFSSYTGHLVVYVRNRNGTGVAGHSVSISGRSIVAPRTTNSSGCVVFAYIKTGAYTASTTTPGFVSATWTAGAFPTTATATTTVAAGETKTLTLEYDQAGKLDLVLRGPADRLQGLTTDTKAPPLLTMTMRHPRLPGGFVEMADVASPAGRVVNVFPFPDAYGVFAGPQLCGSNSYNASTWGGLPGPGQTLQRRLLATVTVLVHNGGGSPRANVNVNIRATNVNCGHAREIMTARTDGSGNASIALPYGTWRLNGFKDGSTENGSSPNVTVDNASTAYQTSMPTTFSHYN